MVMKVTLLELEVVQDLGMSIEEFFKSHMTRLALKAKPQNHLIAKVSDLGNSLYISIGESNDVLLCMLVPFELS
jgi:hypothetical protein